MQNGQTDLIAPALLALNVGQFPGSLLLLAAASRLERRKWPLIGMGLLGLASLAGIVFSTSAWAIALAAAGIGFSCAIGLTLLLSLPVLLFAADDVRGCRPAVHLGYGVAVLVSVIGGAAWDLTACRFRPSRDRARAAAAAPMSDQTDFMQNALERLAE